MDDAKDAATTVYTARPRFEGSNVGIGIGFKHVMYLAEEAVLEHLRERGLSPQSLFENHGLCCEIVDSELRILHLLHMDDLVTIKVRPTSDTDRKELTQSVVFSIEHNGKTRKAATGKVSVLFRQDQNFISEASPPPAAVVPYIRNEIHRPGSQNVKLPTFTAHHETEKPDDFIVNQLVKPGSNAFVWKWRIPYFYCHFTDRLQHSGYLRLMEAVVDLFLADRGISIRTMLDTRRWIPIVSRARVEILREALMEESLYTVYTVEEVFKNLTYTARMDCYVCRGESLVHTATGRIVHGYGKLIDAFRVELVPFDAETISALQGKAR